MAKLLVVDDEPAICWGLTRLGEDLGHEVTAVSSAEQALVEVERERPDLVILDVRLPGMDGLAAIEKLRVHLGAAPIVIITAYGDLRTAVEAIRRGAFEYVVKPFDLAQVERVIGRALRSAATVRRAPPPQVRGELIGSSPPMQEVFKRIALAAAADACVLVSGESGTGKELAARAIHKYSARAAGPFVAVNVAALSSSLAESELFGHVRGAFTGAEQPRKGLIVEADGGTLFLDEVADIPLAVQVKLLRALEHREVIPVGSSQPAAADFRVISATHQDLPACVREGKFREDLYFRLAAFQIELPPLRQRGEDVVALAEFFLAELSRRGEQRPPALPPETLAELKRRPWQGNVRELRNAIEHAMILARGGVLLPEHLPPPVDAALPVDLASIHQRDAEIGQRLERWSEAQLAAAAEHDAVYDRLLALVEPPLLRAALRRSKGQVAVAARMLGLHRTTLKKKLDQYGIAEE